jgi:mRNA-degrading endonuclease RelE of RelBE toxin-antitoxin system
MKKLAPKHAELAGRYADALVILSVDPHNKSSKFPIKKLHNVAEGEGQYRLRSGRFRFRYDILESQVILHYCGLRREDTC